MKIGITERGDAGLDLSWFDKLSTVNGTILITKNIRDIFIEKVIQAVNNNHKIIVHCTCTGWGTSVVEPNVPLYAEQLNNLKKLISKGFPIENCVLRIDPIIPTKSGLKQVENLIKYTYSIGLLPKIRVRISILDEYKHVKNRIKDVGFQPFYVSSFQAPKSMIEATYNTLSKFNIKYETCAEPMLNSYDIFEKQGCISEKDLKIMELSNMNQSVNPQNRNGCLCLSCKTELLTNAHQCMHGCLYCYWH